MEVFIRNLPAQGDLSAKGLRVQLRPFMEKLGIEEHSYECEKARKLRYGNIIFLDAEDAVRFLDAHGSIDSPFGGRPISRLKFLSADVLCRESKRQPNQFALRVLASKAEKAREPQPQGADDRHDNAPVVFGLTDLSCGHYTYTDDQLTFVSEVEWPAAGVAKFAKKNLVISLSPDILGLYGGTSIRIPISSIFELVWSPRGTLTLTLSTVPGFFSSCPTVEDLMAAMYGGQPPEKRRYTSMPDCEVHAKVVGLCLVYHLRVAPDDDLYDIIGRLEHRTRITISRFDVSTQRSSPFSPSDTASSLQSLHVTFSQMESQGSLPFDILFQLQALVYNNRLHPAKVHALAHKLHSEYAQAEATGEKPPCVEALRKLFEVIKRPRPHGDSAPFEVASLVNYIKEAGVHIREGFSVGDRPTTLGRGQSLTRIHRVVVTPTRLTLHGPELDNTNRVLRKFPKHHNYFIRVQFCDEDYQGLRFNANTDCERVYTRFRKVLTDGIRIAGRVYEFLGWSHSSLRSHSVWFSAPFLDDSGTQQTRFTIVSALGDFSNIFSPAKCAARIGQAFSETPYAVPLRANDIVVDGLIPDVVFGERVFSDGVGTISSEALRIVWDYLPFRKSYPTCLQIRLAGAKGMLSLDSRLNGRQICIRPSMEKFTSNESENLEICDLASAPMPLVLNRQLVKILEDIGVPKTWFTELQDAALKELREITVTPYNAANFLKKQCVADSIKPGKIIKFADRQGFDYRQEPFLRLVVEAVVLRELRLLKHKARIPVWYGVTLFGVMDETGFLEEGEVYVTYDPSAKQRQLAPPPEAGPLLITRSPALHPGDVQLARNVNPPHGHPLLDLINCVIFSSKGARDLPSQLSGGDLDGDIYNIIWDPLACEAPALQTFPPADYPRATPENIGRTVQIHDIAKFFVDFMNTDILGVIAIRHMILADQKGNGTLDPDCIKLAELHSTAVDFSKTGIPVDLKALPQCNKYRPDFLAPGPVAHMHDRSEIELEQYMVQAEDEDEDDADGPTYKYYKSNKILGELYRGVDERKIWHEDVRTTAPADAGAFWDSFMYCAMQECNEFGDVRWARRKEEAKRIRSAYDDSIQAAMINFSEHPVHPISELEVFIGHIINNRGSQTQRQRERSSKLRDEFDRISTWIMAQMRPNSGFPLAHEGPDEADQTAPDTDTNTKASPTPPVEKGLDDLELCLACLHISLDGIAKGEASGRPGRQARVQKGLQSFRLVAASALLAEINSLAKERRLPLQLGSDGFV